MAGVISGDTRITPPREWLFPRTCIVTRFRGVEEEQAVGVEQSKVLVMSEKENT